MTKKPATLSSDIGVRGTLRGDSVYRVTLTDRGGKVTGTNLARIATGLRNAAGFAIHPVTSICRITASTTSVIPTSRTVPTN